MKRTKRTHWLSIFLIANIMMMTTIGAEAQNRPAWFNMPELPDAKGFAGMYAGVSHGNLFCMGGANFPGKYPWEGGKKMWYNGIYMLQQGGKWKMLKQRLPFSSGYGFSVSYKGEIIIIGGCDAEQHFNTVLGCTWTGEDLRFRPYPPLPVPLAYMTGGLIKNIIVVAGGAEAPGHPPIQSSYALDLLNTDRGWIQLDGPPGPERVLPAAAVYDDQLYIFSGETTTVNTVGDTIPLILQDAYRLSLSQSGSSISGTWAKLAPMPRGAAAISNPLPVLKNGNMLFWGGVDAMSRLHKDPSTFPGISGEMLFYDPQKDIWSYAGEEKVMTARVTLPAVLWNDQWIYISGEIKPGIRTTQVTAFKNY